MLYIIERTKDSYYLSCFEEYKQYVQKLKEIGFDEYIIIPAKELK